MIKTCVVHSPTGLIYLALILFVAIPIRQYHINMRSAQSDLIYLALILFVVIQLTLLMLSHN